MWLNVTTESERYEDSIDLLNTVAYPFAAALDFSDAVKTLVSRVHFENVTISENNKTVTLEVIPIRFY